MNRSSSYLHPDRGRVVKPSRHHKQSPAATLAIVQLQTESIYLAKDLTRRCLEQVVRRVNRGVKRRRAARFHRQAATPRRPRTRKRMRGDERATRASLSLCLLIGRRSSRRLSRSTPAHTACLYRSLVRRKHAAEGR